MKLGWYQAQALQEYQVMAILLKNAFGAEEKEKAVPYNSVAEAQAALSKVFGS